MKFAVLVALVGLTVSSCTKKISNDFSSNLAVCGEGSEQWQDGQYIKILDTSGQELPAYAITAAINADKLAVSAKNCIQNPSQDEGLIVIREIRPGSQKAALIELQELSYP